MSGSNCHFLTCMQVSREAGKVVWYSHLLKNFPQFVVIRTVKGFGIVNKAEVDVFLELSCFFDDSIDVGNLISGSSAFSKYSLYSWKLSVHVLLKPSLENLEHYSASLWNECNCTVVCSFFGVAFFGIGMKIDLFQSCVHRWVFQIFWHIECSTLTASLFRIWNSSAGIPSPPPASPWTKLVEMMEFHLSFLGSPLILLHMLNISVYFLLAFFLHKISTDEILFYKNLIILYRLFCMLLFHLTFSKAAAVAWILPGSVTSPPGETRLDYLELFV